MCFHLAHLAAACVVVGAGMEQKGLKAVSLQLGRGKWCVLRPVAENKRTTGRQATMGWRITCLQPVRYSCTGLLYAVVPILLHAGCWHVQQQTRK